MIRTVLLLVLTLFPPMAFACSFAQPTPVEFDATLARAGEAPPPAPLVTVESIKRGNSDDPGDSCSDLGLVVLSMPATRKNKEVAYTFELVSGSADDTIFYSVPCVGLKSEGKYLFVFPWLDGARSTQEPLNLVVRVTAFRRSGLQGESADVTITDPGR